MGKAFSYLQENGASLTDQDMLPIILFSSVSGVFRLVQSGLISPCSLVDGKYVQMVRNILNNDFSRSTQYQMFELPLISQRLLNIAIIATYCSLLESDWVQNLAILVLDQLEKILSINQLVVIDKMYKDLKIPKTLQQLARVEVHRNLQEVPARSLEKLSLPKQIKSYLLFCDVNINDMIKDYKDTIDHINDNGVSNIIQI